MSAVHTQDPLIHRKIDRYRLMELIGVGSTGRVYRAIPEHGNGSPIAMKVIWGELGSDARLMQRFQRAVAASKQIQHPNVVQNHGLCVTASGLSYLTMELVHGPSLRERLGMDHRLSPWTTCRVGIEVISGLRAAHEAGFIHRDIKPANIVLRDNQPTQIKILDFGLIGVSAAEEDVRITASGSFVGTPLYMAPEQARCASEAGPPADIYSLGVMMFEMVTGRPPFTGQTPLEVVIAHTTHAAPHLHHLGALGDLIAWTLEKNPMHRPQSAALLEAQLRSTLSELTSFPLLSTSCGMIETADLDPIAFDSPT